MPLPYTVLWELHGIVVDKNTGYEKDVLISVNSTQAAAQTDLTNYTTSGVLADGTPVKNLVVREVAKTVTQQGPDAEGGDSPVGD